MSGDEFPITLSVPEAGAKYFNLSRAAAYDAAARGDLPVIRIGKLLRVPVRALERLLDNAGAPAPPAKPGRRRGRVASAEQASSS